MIETTSLLKSLSAPDPAARQQAKQSLEALLQKSDYLLADCIELAEQIENEREARVLSGILGRLIDELHLPSMVHLTVDDEGWVSSIARRAIRTWLESVSPVEAARGLHHCLVAAADLNDSRADEFVCTAIVEKVSQGVHLAYRPLLTTMEGIILQRSGSRHSMTWLLGAGAQITPNAYTQALATLQALVPQGDLPLPAENTSSAQDLPRPASEGSVEDTTQLPLPADSSSSEPSLSLWERLFGRRAK